MDEARVRQLLAALAAELGERTILWRGAEPTGSDIDVLVLNGARGELEGRLAHEGLERRDDGHWAAPEGEVVVDPVDEADWPPAYPAAAGIAERAEYLAGSPPVASAADRMLIFAAEAVAGRPLAKLLPKLRALMERPEVVDDALALGASEGALSLARLAAEPDRLERAQVRGVLSYRMALATGIRSRRGRAAVRTRLAATAERRLRGRGRRARRQGA